MGQVESSFGGPADVNEKALAAIADFIQQVQPGAMTQKFVLLVETIDEDDRWLSAFVAPGQKRWDSMGLLDYGLTMERNTSLVSEEDDDEDDG